MVEKEKKRKRNGVRNYIDLKNYSICKLLRDMFIVPLFRDTISCINLTNLLIDCLCGRMVGRVYLTRTGMYKRWMEN